MKSRFAAVGLLLLLAWLELSTLAVTSPTVDEPLHIMRGSAYVRRGEERYLMYGPVLPNALSGLGLLAEPDLQLYPVDDPVWNINASMQHPQAFIWNNAVPAERIFFWGRLPIIAVSLLLGAFIFRWACERTNGVAAVGALALYVFSPNLLAHSRLATTDSVTAAAFLIGTYAFDKALRTPGWRTWLFSGIMLGVALAAKFSATALVLAFGLLALLRVWQLRKDRVERLKPIGTLVVTVVIGSLALWGIYRFSFGPIVPGGPGVPAPYYWREWVAMNEYLKAPWPGYLFGELGQPGWWYYYPITFLTKTPLPELIFLLLALLRTLRSRSWANDLVVYLVPALFFGALLFSPHDLGYRYLLPVVPFIFIAAADVIAAARKARWTTIAVALLIAWQIIGTLRYYPYYLPYFNDIVGGPDRGRYILSDSNIDWGQDLISLKQYVDQHAIDHIKFSYFGITPPDRYGLSAEVLPPLLTGIQDQPRWKLRTLQPSDPAPGVYAISAVNLMQPDGPYGYFRDRQPDTVIGGSIYVYTVPPRGIAVDLALGGLQIEQIDAATYARLNTNDVRPRWFKPGQSLIAAPESMWVALADGTLAPELKQFLSGVTPEIQAQVPGKERPYGLYHLDLSQRLNDASQRATHTVAFSPDLYPQASTLTTVTLPVRFGDAADLIGYQIITSTTDHTTSILTYWRATKSITTPVELFIHAVNADGQIVTQHDGFGASAFGWHGGDLIAQLSRLDIPANVGPLWLELGLYNPDSSERLPIMVDNREVDRRLLLTSLEAQ